MRWVRLGLFQSIRPTIKYQPSKANIVADSLSWNQRGTSDADGEDRGRQWTMNEEEDTVFALIGIIVTMQPKEIKKWKQAYEDDTKLNVAIQHLWQGKAFEQF